MTILKQELSQSWTVDEGLGSKICILRALMLGRAWAGLDGLRCLDGPGPAWTGLGRLGCLDGLDGLGPAQKSLDVWTG